MKLALLTAFFLFASPLASRAQLPPDWRARLLVLEASRSGDATRWERLWKETRRDPHAHALVLRGLGRVAHPALSGLLETAVSAPDSEWSDGARSAAALSVGLFGKEELVARLIGLAPPPDLALALGLLGRLPEDEGVRKSLMAVFDPKSPFTPGDDPLGLQDGVCAALLYGAAVGGGAFLPLATTALSGGVSTRQDAALYHLWRRAEGPPLELRDRVLAEVSSRGERAAMAARVLARYPSGTAEAAARISEAFLKAKPSERVAQIGRLRALGTLADSNGLPAWKAGIASPDPQIRRCAWEAAGAWVGDEAIGSFLGLFDHERVVDVRRAALLALGELAPQWLDRRLPELRFAAPVPLRAAAARALLRRPKAELSRLRPFMEDPDRRVRMALIEELCDRIEAGKIDQAGGGKVVGELAFNVLKSLFPLLERHNGTKFLPRFFASFGEVAPQEGPKLRPFCAADPVLLGLGARLLGLMIEKRWMEGPPDSEGRPLLLAFLRRIPPHEVEAMQLVVRFAELLPTGASERFLRRLLVVEDIAIRLQARGVLLERGLGPVPYPERLEGAALTRFRARSEKIAAAVEEDPRPRVVIRTSRGELELELYREDAPLTVDSFLSLAANHFFDGMLWHRVVPGHVVQAGCPRGDGWGGPSRTLPCEISARHYHRGTLGMALAGKDTGGSQWFLPHRPRPHLGGRFTIFGHLTRGDDVLSALLPGDVILSLKRL